MKTTNQNPIIEVKKINGSEFIYFTFKGKLLEKDAAKAIVLWKNHLEKSNISPPHVWNCMEMTGYEPMARILWQNAMKELKSKIGKIWFISDSTIILAGAKILSMFTSFEIQTVKSEKEITNRLQPKLS